MNAKHPKNRRPRLCGSRKQRNSYLEQIWGFRVEVWGLGFGVEGLGFKDFGVWGLGFRVFGLRDGEFRFPVRFCSISYSFERVHLQTINLQALYPKSQKIYTYIYIYIYVYSKLISKEQQQTEDGNLPRYAVCVCSPRGSF